MAQRIFEFEPTATAISYIGGPHLLLTMSMPAVIVDAIEVIIPNGHMGLTRLMLAMSNAQIIPETPGSYIRGNDEKITWDLLGYLDTGQWQAWGHSYDLIFDHSWIIRFLCRLPGINESPAPMLPQDVML